MQLLEKIHIKSKKWIVWVTYSSNSVYLWLICSVWAVFTTTIIQQSADDQCIYDWWWYEMICTKYSDMVDLHCLLFVVVICFFSVLFYYSKNKYMWHKGCENLIPVSFFLKLSYYGHPTNVHDIHYMQSVRHNINT